MARKLDGAMDMGLDVYAAICLGIGVKDVKRGHLIAFGSLML